MVGSLGEVRTIMTPDYRLYRFRKIKGNLVVIAYETDRSLCNFLEHYDAIRKYTAIIATTKGLPSELTGIIEAHKGALMRLKHVKDWCPIRAANGWPANLIVSPYATGRDPDGREGHYLLARQPDAGYFLKDPKPAIDFIKLVTETESGKARGETGRSAGRNPAANLLNPEVAGASQYDTVCSGGP